MGKSESLANSIRVALVDDDPEMQEIIATLLNRTEDIDLVGSGVNGLEALALCEELQPDVLLLDVMMPVMDGIEAAGLLRERFPELKILVLSSLHDYESVQGMMQNKVNGYISKSTLVRGLAENIRATHQGTKVFSDEAFLQLVPTLDEPEKNDFDLTDREMEALALMAAGLDGPDIARKMKIRHSTFKFHVKNICRKLKVRTRSQALAVAMKNHLL